MLNKLRNIKTVETRVMFGVLLIILVLANTLIVSKERVLTNGAVVLLELAPRDPRSILQGDYMILRYRMANRIAEASNVMTEDGYVVVSLDSNGVATFKQFNESGSSLKHNERLLRYRKRNGVVKIATNAFFFQEKHGRYYSSARYGVVRSSDDGEVVLAGLRDADFRDLKPEIKE